MRSKLPHVVISHPASDDPHAVRPDFLQSRAGAQMQLRINDESNDICTTGTSASGYINFSGMNTP
jgi:hypothetical protein